MLAEFNHPDEVLNSNVDNVGDTGDMTLFMRPVDTSIIEKDLEFFDHPVIVRGAVRRDAIDLFEDFVFLEDSHELRGKIEASMFPMYLTKIQQCLDKIESLVNIMTSDSYMISICNGQRRKQCIMSICPCQGVVP